MMRNRKIVMYLSFFMFLMSLFVYAQEEGTPLEEAAAAESAPAAETAVEESVPVETEDDTPYGSIQKEAGPEEIDTEVEREAGAYERKSVSYVNALWLLDATSRMLSGDQVRYILDKIQEGISFGRFDYNPLPESIVESFVRRANTVDRLTIDEVASLMETELVPQIMKVLELEKEARAANLLTEQQQNSFYSDKAKELGITGGQIMKIMNAAYIYVPVISDFIMARTGEKENKSWKATAQMGILWYSIKLVGDKPQVTLRVKRMTTSFGLARMKKRRGGYVLDGNVLSPRQYAFRSMVKNGVKNLIVATQEIADFNLSGQILESSFMHVGFNLGEKEGILVDDKYRVVQQTEESDGSVREVPAGWIMVSRVANAKSREGYKSKGIVISGAPEQGDVLREYPRIPIDIHLAFRKYSYADSTIDQGDSITSGGMGVEVNALYNVGRLAGMNQLFFGFSLGFGSVGLSGAGNYSSATINNLDAVLLKKFYIRRFALAPEARLGLLQMRVYNTSTETEYTNAALGLTFLGNVEFALTPSLNIGAGAGMQLHGAADWDEDPAITVNTTASQINHSGLAVKAYLVWSPPRLPFDPWEMLRGMAGI